MRNVVVVGAGGMGRAWMDAIARRADTRVSAVVDVDPAAARGAVEERGWDIPTMQNVEEALALVEADMLLNVTVPEAHLAVSSAALRAGVPVLSEKPVTPTVRDALQLLGLSKATGVLLATSQSRRYSSGIRLYRQAVTDLGQIGQLDAQFFQNPRFGGFREEMDHPLLVDMAIHTFDQARYILDADPVSVYCDEFNPPWSWYRGAAAAQAIFRFADGTRFSYSGSWCADGLTTSWNATWRASAQSGAARWDGERGVVVERAAGDVRGLEASDGDEGLDAALAEFVAALDGGPHPSGEISRNVWSLAMVEAAIESSRSQAPVLFADVFSAALASALEVADADVAAALQSSRDLLKMR